MADSRRMVTLAWNGAGYDYVRRRMYLTVPGGHNDWYPNQSFEIRLFDGPSILLHDWTPYPGQLQDRSDGVRLFTDGKPVSRHTYSMPIWLPVQKRVLMVAGATWPLGKIDRMCGWLDPETGTWEYKDLWPFQEVGLSSAYDFRRNEVISGIGPSLMWIYDPATDASRPFPQIKPDPYNRFMGPYFVYAIDPVGDYLYGITRGGILPNEPDHHCDLIRIELGEPEPQAWQKVEVSGDAACLRATNPGIDYDAGLHAFVLWDFAAPERLGVLRLDTMAIEYIPIAKPPGVEDTTKGVFGRFRCVESRVYALMTSPFHVVQEIRI